MRSNWLTWGGALLAMLIVSAVYFYKLGTTPLWGDEASTGVFARNTLSFGYPAAFDGRNLTFYDSGAELNANLIEAKIPWVQFYLGALSLKLFGNDALGLRFMFSLVGLATLLPLWAALRTRVRMPLFLSTLVLITPQIALFHRNARYYSALTLLFATLVWVVCNNDLSAKKRFWVTTACMVLMFNTHQVAAAACAASLVAHGLAFRSHRASYLSASALGLLSWLLWTWAVGPAIVAPSLFMDFRGQGPLDWPSLFARNVWMAISDIDAVQGLPLLGWVLCLALLFAARPKGLRELPRDPFISFVLTACVVQIVLVAVLLGTETRDEHSLLRYMPHLLAFGIASLFVLIGKVVRREYLLAPLCLAVVLTNFLTLSYWLPQAAKPIPWSWWPSTYSEIWWPQPDSVEVAMNEVQKQHANSGVGSETLLVVPDWLQEVANFHIGQQLTVIPSIPPGSAAETAVRSKLGGEALLRLRQPPQWVIHASHNAPPAVQGYERTQIKSYRLRPGDGTRPELTRHAFNVPGQDSSISVYRRMP